MTDAITRSARGRDCQIRLPGICSFDPEQTVFAHIRLNGISGFGIKAPPIGSFACYPCHMHCDSHHDAATSAAFAEGVYRTLNILWREGVLRT